MPFQVGREGAAACRGGPMHRTGTADLVLPRLYGDEAEQVEDVGHADQGANFTEAESRHGTDQGGTRRISLDVVTSSCPDRANREEEPVLLAVGKQRQKPPLRIKTI